MPQPISMPRSSWSSSSSSGTSSPVRRCSRSPLADGQLDSPRLRQKRRWHCVSSSSSFSQGCASPRPIPSHPHSPRLFSHGGESSGGRGVSVQGSAGLASSAEGVRSHLSPLRSPGHRSVRVGSVCSSSSLLRVGRRSRGRSLRRSGTEVGVQHGLCLSSSSSPSSRRSETGGVDGRLPPRHASLARSEVVSSPSSSPRRVGVASAGAAAGGGSFLRRSSASSPPSSRLEDFRRLHGLSVSDAAFNLIGGSWRPSSSARYDAVWSRFLEFLHARGVSLSSVGLGVVADYLASLFSSGRAYRTITLHRSVLSSMFPPMGGFSLGTHPLLSRLVRGVFQQRPPSRRLFPSWDVASVFAIFDAMAPPLDFISLQRRCAFFLAMASARRPSELAALRCDAAFMSISSEQVRFLPSRLSKTDRQRHLGPPIVIRRLPPPDPHCPVASLEELLRSRAALGIRHDYVFSSSLAPHDPISVASFSGLLRWAFRRAGIAAPPGSTRAISVSDAVARGVSIEEALRAGDWSGAGTFYRHYLRPSGSL